MLPTPLHAAVVHFPIVLVVFLPISALIALYAIHRGVQPLRAWAFPLALAGLLVLSAFVALRTGEGEEERVEGVVGEQIIDRHAEAAERFMVLSGVLLLVATAGLMRGVVGRSARLVASVGTLGLVVLGVQVGHAGGQLVYRHGAASAYTQPAAAGAEGNGPVGESGQQRAEVEEDSK